MAAKMRRCDVLGTVGRNKKLDFPTAIYENSERRNDLRYSKPDLIVF